MASKYVAVFLWLLSSCWSAIGDVDGAGEATKQCAYSASGVVATPLGACSVYAQQETTGRGYSYTYSYDPISGELNWNYFSDLSCSSLLSANPMDSTMMALHNANSQVLGEGASCDTVEIVKKGSYSPYTDECSMDGAAASDFTSMSFVVNECISAAAAYPEPAPDSDPAAAPSPSGYSAVLLCDAEKIWVNYYGGCADCKCDAEQYVYKSYADDECWAVQCHAVATSKYHKLVASQLKLFGAHNLIDPKMADQHENAATVVIDSFVSAQIPYTLPGAQEERSRVLSHSFGRWAEAEDAMQNLEISALGVQIKSIWMYSAIGSVLFIVFCGICRYINTYDAVYYEVHAKGVGVDAL